MIIDINDGHGHTLGSTRSLHFPVYSIAQSSSGFFLSFSHSLYHYTYYTSLSYISMYYFLHIQ